MKYLLQIVLFLALSVSPAWAELAPEIRWADPSSVDLNVEFPGEGYHASWQMYRCDCGDLMVHADLNVPGEAVSGDLILVENRAVLSRGFGVYKQEAAASLDAAALMMQLALRLLERSEPAGPSRVAEKVSVGVKDDINPILLDTGMAVGGFQAPWSVEGTLEPAGEQQRKFDLTFHFAVDTGQGVQEGEIRLNGLADFTDVPFPVSDGTSLTGWGMDWRDPSDPAVGTIDGVATLGELRKLLQTR